MERHPKKMFADLFARIGLGLQGVLNLLAVCDGKPNRHYVCHIAAEPSCIFFRKAPVRGGSLGFSASKIHDAEGRVMSLKIRPRSRPDERSRCNTLSRVANIPRQFVRHRLV